MSTKLLQKLPTGWHQAYCTHDRCINCFPARPRKKDCRFHLHVGEKRSHIGTVIKTIVVVFPQPQSRQMARRLSADLQEVKELTDQQPKLGRHLEVVGTQILRVESVEYLPGQAKTVQKEDSVVVQERVKGGSYVRYDQSRDDLSQFRLKHPKLARLIDSSARRQKVITCLRAVLVGEVYHLTFVAFYSSGGDEDAESIAGGCTISHLQDDVSGQGLDTTDGCISCPCLAPTAPELQLIPTAPEPEVLLPTAPEPETLKPTTANLNFSEPLLQEEEEAVSRDTEGDAPPPYSQHGRGFDEGIWGLPPYQIHQDPPPAYDAVDWGFHVQGASQD